MFCFLERGEVSVFLFFGCLEYFLIHEGQSFLTCWNVFVFLWLLKVR